MTVKIITDSGCDLDETIVKKLDLEIMSIIITNGEKEYLDKREINSDEVFKGQRIGESFGTSQISIFEYYTKFKEYLQRGKEFIYVSLSSALSGSYNNAIAAIEKLKEEFKNKKFASVDSKAASVGESLIVYYMATCANKGATFEELIELSEFLTDKVRHLFTVFDIEYLYRGGRISRTGRNIGKMLNIRPIIDMEDGELKVKDIKRGNKKAYKAIIDETLKNVKDNSEREKVFLVYGEEESLISPLKETYSENRIKLLSNQLGCTIAVHTGPDIIGNAYLKERIPEKFTKYIE
ncbi:DegV family protein [Peptoniphilus sp. ING2-D1G]|nr:DegV family protein [Peptoniphilus sp. ING2-D1G]